MNIHPKIKEILNNRGIAGDSEISEFLSDKPQKTYDPFLLLNMEEGVDLILSAIDEGERICIYGDYDADGITSTAVLMEVLSNLTDNLTYYIPSRFDEGYGLNCKAIDRIKADNVNLIVTVDCGSVSYDEVEYAKSLGLKVLVTDHHTIADRIADCPVINPMQPDCPYPFKRLAGVGVAFKLAQAIVTVTGLPKSVVTKTLDVVGIGTIGDIVPLLDENRTIAKYGIRMLNLTERPGISSLIEGISLKKGNINSGNISFGIVPHINAAGRMDHAYTAARLIMSQSASQAREGVSRLIKFNNLRKSRQEAAFKECEKLISEKYMDDNFLVIQLEDAHEGITGIVAGKIKEKYYRPAVIVTPIGDGLVKGTGRSIPGVNLYSLLKESEELFEKFGGHAAACGFSMKMENVDELRKNLNRSLEVLIEEEPDLMEEKLEVDSHLEAGDICLELVKELELLEPFGAANPQPVFSFRGRPCNIKKMGADGQYTRFTAVLENGKEHTCVIFKNAPEYDELLKTGEYVTIIGTLESQNWNGREYLQTTVLSVEK
ncbi:MAG: single-stranded-DNA-specific exonuclease RecJ [Firmicutes bacterium]|nr:single-stranded-DNA-specific exonuclease RecJ [Bacillota bacterium]